MADPPIQTFWQKKLWRMVTINYFFRALVTIAWLHSDDPIESMIRGYHEYKLIWNNPVVGEDLLCEHEVGNPHAHCSNKENY